MDGGISEIIGNIIDPPSVTEKFKSLCDFNEEEKKNQYREK